MPAGLLPMPWIRGAETARHYLPAFQAGAQVSEASSRIQAQIVEAQNRLAAQQHQLEVETQLKREQMEQQHLEEQQKLEITKQYHDQQAALDKMRLEKTEERIKQAASLAFQRWQDMNRNRQFVAELEQRRREEAASREKYKVVQGVGLVEMKPGEKPEIVVPVKDKISAADQKIYEEANQTLRSAKIIDDAKLPGKKGESARESLRQAQQIKDMFEGQQGYFTPPEEAAPEAPKKSFFEAVAGMFNDSPLFGGPEAAKARASAAAHRVPAAPAGPAGPAAAAAPGRVIGRYNAKGEYEPATIQGAMQAWPDQETEPMLPPAPAPPAGTPVDLPESMKQLLLPQEPETGLDEEEQRAINQLFPFSMP